MKITIYQIIPELDQDRLMFMPLSYYNIFMVNTPYSQ